MSEDFQIVDPYIRAHDRSPIHRIAPKINRNDYCNLEGKKFKHCCGKNNNIDYCPRLLNDYLEKNFNMKTNNETKEGELEPKVDGPAPDSTGPTIDIQVK